MKARAAGDKETVAARLRQLRSGASKRIEMRVEKQMFIDGRTLLTGFGLLALLIVRLSFLHAQDITAEEYRQSEAVKQLS